MPPVSVSSACPLPSLPHDPTPHPVRVCVIDLGTNSFHTVIVDVFPNGSFTVVDRLKDMVKLGEGGFRAHQLTEAAMARGLAALERVKLLAEARGVRDYLAFATSAIREAANGGAFIRAIRKATGLRIRPITGAQEALLICKGVQRAVNLDAPTLLVDIGGGSTEFVVATAQEILFTASYKIGAARMTEAFLTTDPVSSEEAGKLRRHYRRTLRPVYEAVQQHGVRHLVGSSGTMENLALVHTGTDAETNGGTIFQQAFAAQPFRQTASRIRRMDAATRDAEPGIDDKRVPQIAAGALLVEVLLKDLPFDTVRLSPNALREGMVVYYTEQNQPRVQQLAALADVRRRSIYELGFRCRWDQAHAEHVTALALHLFDACRPLHGLGLAARETLEYAALLHDIGYHISHRAHHKHSYYLIHNADLHGFSPVEIERMALVARYHRKSFPKPTHPEFQALPPAQQQEVLHLAACLRLAEGLDRSQFQNVATLSLALRHDALHLTLHTKADPQLDVWGAEQGTDLFTHLYGLPVTVQLA